MRFCLALTLTLALQAQPALASDACSNRAIVTGADVTVSDGSGFRTESFYRSKDSAAIRHLDDRDRIVAVEGPIGWASDGERAESGSDFYKLFALGHQYHALLMEFDIIAANVGEGSKVEFDGEMREATSGDYPYGGTVHLVRGEDESRPAGLRFDFPEDTVIIASFLDWREQNDRVLPYHIRIDDGERTFDCRPRHSMNSRFTGCIAKCWPRTASATPAWSLHCRRLLCIAQIVAGWTRRRTMNSRRDSRRCSRHSSTRNTMTSRNRSSRHPERLAG